MLSIVFSFVVKICRKKISECHASWRNTRGERCREFANYNQKSFHNEPCYRSSLPPKELVHTGAYWNNYFPRENAAVSTQVVYSTQLNNNNTPEEPLINGGSSNPCLMTVPEDDSIITDECIGDVEE